MSWIDVVSIGPGTPEYLTKEAQETITCADIVYCSDRCSSLVCPEKRKPIIPLDKAMDAIAAAFAGGKRVAVLVSGDAGLYSLLAMIQDRFGNQSVLVHPGISSVQMLCARLGVAWQESAILSVHGRKLSPSALCHAVRTHSKTIILLDPCHDAAWLRQIIDLGGLHHASIITGSRLGYPDETVECFTGEKNADSSLSIALINNSAPQKGLPPIGIPDDAFVRSHIPMTKKEIRVQLLSMMRPELDSVIWDVGAGTGSVSIECGQQCPEGQVYAIEREAEAVSLIKQNMCRFHLLNLHVISGLAPEAFTALPAPTHVFLGGTGGKAAEIIGYIKSLKTPVRLCAAAVTLDTVHLLHREMKEMASYESVQITATRVENIAGYAMMRAQTPVFLFAGTTPGG